MNCWYYSVLLISGNVFLKCFCALFQHPLSTGGFLHKLGTRLEGMCRDIVFGAPESKIYIWNKKKSFWETSYCPIFYIMAAMPSASAAPCFTMTLINLSSSVLAVLWVWSGQRGCRICPVSWLGNLCWPAACPVFLFTHNLLLSGWIVIFSFMSVLIRMYISGSTHSPSKVCLCSPKQAKII